MPTIILTLSDKADNSNIQQEDVEKALVEIFTKEHCPDLIIREGHISRRRRVNVNVLNDKTSFRNSALSL